MGNCSFFKKLFGKQFWGEFHLGHASHGECGLFIHAACEHVNHWFFGDIVLLVVVVVVGIART